VLDHPLIADEPSALNRAKALWAAEFPNEPWDCPVGVRTAGASGGGETGDAETKASMVAAMERQKSFYYQVNMPGFLVGCAFGCSSDAGSAFGVWVYSNLM
jgi:hypothetical protein